MKIVQPFISWYSIFFQPIYTKGINMWVKQSVLQWRLKYH